MRFILHIEIYFHQLIVRLFEEQITRSLQLILLYILCKNNQFTYFYCGLFRYSSFLSIFFFSQSLYQCKYRTVQWIEYIVVECLDFYINLTHLCKCMRKWHTHTHTKRNKARVNKFTKSWNEILMVMIFVKVFLWNHPHSVNW